MDHFDVMGSLMSTTSKGNRFSGHSSDFIRLLRNKQRSLLGVEQENETEAGDDSSSPHALMAMFRVRSFGRKVDGASSDRIRSRSFRASEHSPAAPHLTEQTPEIIHSVAASEPMVIILEAS